MSTLYKSDTGELCLTLRGANENRILTTVRRWTYWRRVDVERDPADSRRCLAVTLIADAAHEPTVREILKRSFGLTFPADGGSSELAEEPLPAARGRR